jgi:hypothetical protein
MNVSVFTTCDLQNTSVMNYLKDCLSAYFGMGATPQSHEYDRMTVNGYESGGKAVEGKN